jgi:hypothetical protein
LKDGIIILITAANPEIGFVITLSALVFNSQEMQQYKLELHLQIEKENEIWHHPSGPLYIQPKEQ